MANEAMFHMRLQGLHLNLPEDLSRGYDSIPREGPVHMLYNVCISLWVS